MCTETVNTQWYRSAKSINIFIIIMPGNWFHNFHCCLLSVHQMSCQSQWSSVQSHHLYALHFHSVVPTSSLLCIQDSCQVFLSICIHFPYILSIWYVGPFLFGCRLCCEHFTGNCFVFLQGGGAGMRYMICKEGRQGPVQCKIESPFMGDQFLLAQTQLFPCLPIYHVPFSCLAYSSTLKMETAGSSEVLTTQSSSVWCHGSKARYTF